MHKGSQTCLPSRTGHSPDSRFVVPDDMMMDSSKQRRAGLGSLARESLTSPIKMPAYSLRDCPPDAITFQNRDGL